MIQFNLLPDVKLEYIRARRLKRTVILLSITIASSALLVLILLFLAVAVFQKKHLNDLSRDINTNSQKLQSTSDLTRILTVQNQLNSLGTLYQSQPVTSRLFGFIQQVTPNAVSISELDLDYAAQTLSIKGDTNSIETINKYADTIKFTTYADGPAKGVWVANSSYKAKDVVNDGGVLYSALTDHTSGSDNEPGHGTNWKGSWKTLPSAFSSVVLSSFSYGDKGVGYQISMKFDPAIFNASNNISSLMVPANFITTRSQIDKPNELFKQTNTQGN
jgi:hypothetical protein